MEEILEHTENAGEAAVSRLETLIEQLNGSVGTLANNTGQIVERLEKLELHRAAEETAHTVREGANDALDSAGAAGDVAVKSVDVPLAVAEDTISDAADAADAAGKAAEKTAEAAASVARRKHFKRRR